MFTAVYNDKVVQNGDEMRKLSRRYLRDSYGQIESSSRRRNQVQYDLI